MKFFKLLLILILCCSCSNVNKNLNWTEANALVNSLGKFQTGDILIKNKVFSAPRSWFGHAAVMVSPWEIGEYPMIGEGYVQMPLSDWLSEKNRKVVALRYNYFTKEFRKRFLINVNHYKNREYRITFNKNNNKYFYCSQYVWYLYYKTAKDLNDKNFDFNFKKNGVFILPYDLLELPNFEEVEFNN